MQEQLSRRERQIMDFIYAHGQAKVSDLVRVLPDPPVRPAIFRMLKILESKGYLKHVEEGREFVFSPAQPVKQAAKSALNRVLATFFGGSIEDALATHLADRTAGMDEEQLKRLARLIRQARQKGK